MAKDILSGERKMRRRPSITTERRLDEGHLATQRARRVRKGDVLMRRCVACFLLALTGVLKSPQYSITYYVCWLLTYLSFFLILPCVLPTDNTRIRVMLFATIFNMACGTVLAVRFALRKAASCSGLVCRFDVGYWVAHAIFAAAVALANFSIVRLPPAQSLDRFWRHCGLYWLMTATASLLSFLVVYYCGKYDKPEYRVAFYGNLALIAVQFLIARLCMSMRFKRWMWRYAASVTITTSHHLLRWLVPSALLLFVLGVRR